MKHLVVAKAGRRVECKPSVMSPGCVQLTILSADRQPLALVTLSPDAAAVLGDALRIEAVDMEAMAQAEAKMAQVSGGAA